MAEHDYPRQHSIKGNFHRLRTPGIDATNEIKEMATYGVMECYFSEETVMLPATDVDIEERRIQQFERYLELDQSQSLTPEWAEFGTKNALEIIYRYLMKS